MRKAFALVYIAVPPFISVPMLNYPYPSLSHTRQNIMVLPPLKNRAPEKDLRSKVFWEEEKQRSVFGDLIY
jgi:hypothetical protein